MISWILGFALFFNSLILVGAWCKEREYERRLRRDMKNGRPRIDVGGRTPSSPEEDEIVRQVIDGIYG